MFEIPAKLIKLKKIIKKIKKKENVYQLIIKLFSSLTLTQIQRQPHS